MYKTIDNFNFDGLAGDFKLVEGIDMFGDYWRHKERTIAGIVTLFVYDSGQAALEFKPGEAIEFLYNDDVAEVFDNLDEVKVTELLEAIARNPIE